MDNPNCSTEHVKGQHLTYENRVEIQLRLKDGWTNAQIAKEIGCAYNTIKNEIARGTVSLYNDQVKRYKADAGQAAYEENRRNSRKQYKRLEVSKFIDFVVEKFFGPDEWSLDASVGSVLRNRIFTREEIVCTKTLYNYVDAGLLKIKNIDLPDKLKRNTKSTRVHINVKKLGNSIEERPKSIENRDEFGHWEIDTVQGVKSGEEPVVLTIVERMTRNSIWRKISGKTAEAVSAAFMRLREEYGSRFSQVFKTITGDNGSEFAELFKQEIGGTQVYFTHPYSSFEKGTNERHNSLLRRFIPKGHRIDGYSDDDISFMADWSNGLPRKILGYRTPEEMFEAELDRIYSA